jgi:branched-chain amino acid transport system ATP-binding protein
LLVEQNALLALKVSQRAYVIDDGQIVHCGSSADLAHDGSRIRTLMGLREDENIPA